MRQLLKSVIKSINRGIANDPEVRKLLERHPRLARFLGRRFSPNEKFGLHLTVGAIVTTVFVFFFFGVLEDYFGRDPLIRADLRIVNLVQIFRTPGFNSAMLFITYLGMWQIVFSGMLLAGIVLALRRRWLHAAVLVISVIGGEVFVWLVKELIARPRPLLVNALAPESSFSFPSGHSFVALSFYGFLTYLVFRAAGNKLLKAVPVLAGALIVLAIGFSRIYLGVHWPSDVLASYAAGAAWLTVLITALEIRRRFGRHDGAPYVDTRKVALVSLALFLLWTSYLWHHFQTHPLSALPPIAETRIGISEKDIPGALFAELPRTSEDITGQPMEPINVIVIGTQAQLTRSFQKAGWFLSDLPTLRNVARLVTAVTLNRPYPQAPGTPSFWDARPNILAFERPTATDSVRERHHIHFWRTPFTLGDQTVWFGTAHFDKAIKAESGIVLPVHTIDPAVDKEREKVKNDLAAVQAVRKVEEFRIVEPTFGSNQAGDRFFTDGKAYVIFLR